MTPPQAVRHRSNVLTWLDKRSRQLAPIHHQSVASPVSRCTSSSTRSPPGRIPNCASRASRPSPVNPKGPRWPAGIHAGRNPTPAASGPVVARESAHAPVSLLP
ncbi:hypothetical protein CDEST_12986 [Colletotrichum destructivum]|uniref:Uncharacterized protein n=1 Tax=Colletotrichum destructivum TaxID=34406 RepID=A0AAX4IXP3_9PEZI|nr:hypothetical protein CDEST_12986 [Colletotrichum destructivum]